MELVIMAGGLGSRFGGLKQIEPIDAHGNFIIDYSIFDAIRCGFEKVVFIIKRENLNAFKQTIGKRIEKHIKTEYVFQECSGVFGTNNVEISREKPLGTGHAVLCAKDAVSSNFAVINADDFYGYDAFKATAEFLKTNHDENTYAITCYEANNTLSENGSVKRGVCEISEGFLKTIVESKIEKNADGSLSACSIDPSQNLPLPVSNDTLVSMNMFAYTKSFMNHLSVKFDSFLTQPKEVLEKMEFFLPTATSELIKENKAKVKVLHTTSKWFGITYKEDKDEVARAIHLLAKKGEYPESLWQ